MKARKLLPVLISVALIIALLATGCGTQKAAKSGVQEITINLGTEPPQMNSVLTTDNTSMNVLRHVCEGLIKLDQNNKPIPGVAKKWDISSDKLTYTFHLRDDSKWSDGSTVTAYDFEYSFKTLLNKDTAAEYAYIAYCIKNALPYNNGEAKAEDVGVKALDEKTLEVKLEQPTPYFLDLMAFVVFLPVKQDYYEKQVNDKGATIYATEADKMLFNGAWTMQEWSHEDKIVLVKNPNYWNAKEINLEKITMLMVKESTTALNMFLGDEADMIGLKGSDVQKVQDEGYETLAYPDGATAYFEFNLTDPIMKNNNIRKALTYAIDRKTFVEKVLKNSSTPALSFTHPIIKGLKKPSFKEELGDLIKDNNSEEAKQLLKKGMEELGLTSMPKISFITDDTDVAKRDAAAYQEAWKKNLDLDVEVLTMPFKSRLARMTNKDFQVVLALWGPDYNDPMTFLDMFETGNGNNHTSYTDKKYDELLSKIRTETDNTKRFNLLMETEKKLMEDLPIGPIYFRNRDYVVKDHLKGVIRNAFQDINLYWAYVSKK